MAMWSGMIRVRWMTDGYVIRYKMRVWWITDGHVIGCDACVSLMGVRCVCDACVMLVRCVYDVCDKCVKRVWCTCNACEMHVWCVWWMCYECVMRVRYVCGACVMCAIGKWLLGDEGGWFCGRIRKPVKEWGGFLVRMTWDVRGNINILFKQIFFPQGQVSHSAMSYPEIFYITVWHNDPAAHPSFCPCH